MLSTRKIIAIIIMLVAIALLKFYVNNKTQPVLETLTCEYLENPIGIDKAMPRFSWIIKAGTRGRRQTAYQVLVAHHRDNLAKNIGEMWDSGAIPSSQSNHIRYSGRPLTGNTTYYWKVRIQDDQGNWSRYSKPANFTTALLKPEDWQAQWIGMGPGQDPKPGIDFYNSQSSETDSMTVIEQSILMRKTVTLTKPIQQARIYVSGLGFYELSINGNRVGNSLLNPAKTNYCKLVLYDCYDVTSLLKDDVTVIGIMLGNGWYNPLKKWWSWRMQWFGSKRAYVQLHLDFTDGTTTIITSDNTWKAALGPIISSCIYDGEIYDAGLEQPGWDQPGFDDSSWDNARVVNAPGGEMVSQLMAPIQRMQVIEPVAMTQPVPGVYVYDMGQNFSGWVRLRVRGNRGNKVVMEYAENLEKNGNIDPKSNNLAKATDVYLLKGQGTEIYEPHFTYHGFRYVRITGFPGKPALDNIQGCVVHSACDQTGAFDCSNDRLNRLHQAILWSQKSNLMGYPTDCPQRDERLGWLGDAHVTAEEAMANFHMPLFYCKWLNDIKSNQDTATGDIPYIAPRPFMDGSGDPPWSSGYLLIVWYYYLHYGDKQILMDHFDAMMRYVEHLETIATDHIVPQSRYGDWASPNADGWWQRGQPLSVSTGYHYYNAIIVARVARILGKEDLAGQYEELARHIKAAYNRQFYHPMTKTYEMASQFSNSFPLFLNIVPDGDRNSVLQNLVNDILERNQGHLKTGILGTKYLIDLLQQEGLGALAYLLADRTGYPGWNDMLQNRTTLSEHWDGTGSNNHVMFGSIGAWFYNGLAGINPVETAPGFAKILIKPTVPPGLSYVTAAIQTVRGRVRSHWQVENNDFYLETTIPGNCSATVYVLARDSNTVTESGKPADQAECVRFLRLEKSWAVYEVGAGTYKFVSKDITCLIPMAFTATPVITPTDSFVLIPATVKVSMACATPGAEIRYSLDGSEPTLTSFLFEQPFRINKSTVVTAKAFTPGYKPSFSSAAAYTFVDPEANGLAYRLYQGTWNQLPDFSQLSAADSGIVYQFGVDKIELKHDFAVIFSGWLDLPRDGSYTFYTSSNDGSKLLIGDILVVDNDGEHTVQEKSGKIDPGKGKHPIKVLYFQTGGSKALVVSWQGPGIAKQVLPAARLFRFMKEG